MIRTQRKAEFFLLRYNLTLSLSSCKDLITNLSMQFFNAMLGSLRDDKLGA